MSHNFLVWGPNPEGGTNAAGQVLPTGWAWLCDCGSQELGSRTQFSAETSAELHASMNTYVYTWLGESPHDLRREAFERLGPGRVNYVWGGMNWDVTVVLDTDRERRDAGRRRRSVVQLVWGDVVTIIGQRPADVAVTVWQPTTGRYR